MISRCTAQRRRKDETDEKFLRRLSHVNLSDKKLDKIQDLDGCSSLVCLYLYENRITVIENLHFAVNLTHLYLQDNNIGTMENLSELVNLRKLFIGGNRITTVQGLESCRQLEELHVQAQRLPPGQPLAFDAYSMMAISDTLQVLNTLKNNLTSAEQFQVLVALDTLDLSMNNITSFDQVGALFAEGCCSRMYKLEMKGNPVDAQHKFRDYVALMSPTLVIMDGREITQTQRQFLINREAAKARARQRQGRVREQQMGDDSQQMGVEGQLLMETQGDYDAVEERRRNRPHIDSVPHKGGGGGADREMYQGNQLPAGVDRDAQKEHLQAHMQFDGEIPEVMRKDPKKQWREEDEFRAVMAGIEERRAFLDEMVAAGKGAEYEATINAQISDQIRELEAIDARRSKEEAQALAQQAQAQEPPPAPAEAPPPEAPPPAEEAPPPPAE